MSKHSLQLLGVLKNDLFSKGTGCPYCLGDSGGIIQHQAHVYYCMSRVATESLHCVGPRMVRTL